MNPLNLIPLPYRLLGLALIALPIAVGLVRWEHKRVTAADAAGYARGHAEYVQLDAAMNRKALVATEASLAETERRLAAQKEIDDAKALELQKARADAAIADAAAGRLRQRVEALIAAARRDQAGPDPAPVAVGQAADDPAGVLANVLGRCVARIRLLASIADERGAAGSACERAYDSLTPEAPPQP